MSPDEKYFFGCNIGTCLFCHKKVPPLISPGTCTHVKSVCTPVHIRHFPEPVFKTNYQNSRTVWNARGFQIRNSVSCQGFLVGSRNIKHGSCIIYFWKTWDNSLLCCAVQCVFVFSNLELGADFESRNVILSICYATRLNGPAYILLKKVLDTAVVFQTAESLSSKGQANKNQLSHQS